MSLVDKARERLDEVREKGARAVLEEKFPKLKEIGGGGLLGGSSGGSSGGLLKDVQERGVLTILGERFPKVKEIREKRILGGGSGGRRGSRGTSRNTLIEEKEVKVRGARVVV